MPASFRHFSEMTENRRFLFPYLPTYQWTPGSPTASQNISFFFLSFFFFYSEKVTFPLCPLMVLNPRPLDVQSGTLQLTNPQPQILTSPPLSPRRLGKLPSLARMSVVSFFSWGYITAVETQQHNKNTKTELEVKSCKQY